MTIKAVKILTYDYVPFIDIEDLANKETFIKVKDFVSYIIEDSDKGSAWKLRDRLNSLLKVDKVNKQINPLLIKEYEDQITLLNFIDLADLSDQEIERLFRSKVVFAIKNSVDILREAKNYILNYNNKEIGINFVNLVMKAMGYNQEKIGNLDLNIKEEKKSVEPTVTNWLRSYNKFFSSGQKRSPLEEGEYLLKDRNVNLLSREDRKILIKLIQLYDFLRFPDQFAEGPIGSKKLKIKTLKLPRETKSDAPVLGEVGSSIEKEILAAYQGDLRQQKAIIKEQEKLQNKFKNDSAKLRAEFFTAVQNKNANRTIAILRILAQQKDLENFLREDAKLGKFLVAIWAKRYGQEFAAEFSKNPAQPKFVRLFLQYVLEERLSLATSDAARIGLQIGNIFVSLGKKGYNKMAYFDVGKKEFVWFGE